MTGAERVCKLREGRRSKPNVGLCGGKNTQRPGDKTLGGGEVRLAIVSLEALQCAHQSGKGWQRLSLDGPRPFKNFYAFDTNNSFEDGKLCEVVAFTTESRVNSVDTGWQSGSGGIRENIAITGTNVRKQNLRSAPPAASSAFTPYYGCCELRRGQGKLGAVSPRTCTAPFSTSAARLPTGYSPAADKTAAALATELSVKCYIFWLSGYSC